MQTGRQLISTEHADTDFITLAEAKSWLRAGNSEDSVIDMLISAVIAYTSNQLGYEVKESLVEYGFDSFVDSNDPIEYIRLRGLRIPSSSRLRVYSRVKAIESVSFVNTSDAIIECASTDWIENPRLMGDHSITIQFVNTSFDTTDANIKYIIGVTEGFAPEDLPKDLKLMMLLKLSQFYDNRQSIIVGASINIMPLGEETILSNYKVYAIR
jgi:hypothetical protein